jgi:anti-sigma B factor antagonist
MSSTQSPATTKRGFHVETHRAADSMVVKCHGKLILEHVAILRSKVRTLIPDEKCIILDLQEVTFMDSSGLGALAGLYVSGRTRGCKLELVNVSAAMRTLLSMTNLLSLFEPAGRCGGRFG